MKTILYILLFVVTINLYSQNADTTEVVIVHVNDIHGRIDQFPYLSALVKEIKQTHKNVLLISAGDMFSGNPVVDKYSEKGFPIIDLMNDLNFDLSTLGNHEFDYGPMVLSKRISDSKFMFIAANMTSKSKGFKQPKPFKIYKYGNNSIAVLGITQVLPSGVPDTKPQNCKSFSFIDGLKKATEYKWLKKENNCLIILSHMGVESDSMLAVTMPEANVIIGGHSHTLLLQPLIVNGVSIVQTGYYLKNAGILTLKFANNKIVSVTDSIVILKNYSKTDTIIQKKVEQYNNNNEFKKVVGIASTKIEGESQLGYLIAEAALIASKADFAFQNSGGIRISEIPSGNITVKQIFELDPFNNEIMLCKMNASQIRELITFGYKKEKKADMISAGLNSEIVLDKDKNITQIKLKLPNGSDIDENKIYNVAINSYVVSSYVFNKTEKPLLTGLTTNDAIFRLLQLKKDLNYTGIESAKIH